MVAATGGTIRRLHIEPQPILRRFLDLPASHPDERARPRTLKTAEGIAVRRGTKR
jgi:hypothetical protein